MKISRKAQSRILAVDDDPGVRRVIVRLLSADYSVQVVADGAAALRRLRDRRPDLLLLDIRLPGVDGLEVLRAARVEVPDLRVVMLTGVADLEEVRAAFAAGACAYLTKPFTSADLRGVVEHVLGSGGGGGGGRPWRIGASASDAEALAGLTRSS